MREFSEPGNSDPIAEAVSKWSFTVKSCTCSVLHTCGVRMAYDRIICSPLAFTTNSTSRLYLSSVVCGLRVLFVMFYLSRRFACDLKLRYVLESGVGQEFSSDCPENGI